MGHTNQETILTSYGDEAHAVKAITGVAGAVLIVCMAWKTTVRNAYLVTADGAALAAPGCQGQCL